MLGKVSRGVRIAVVRHHYGVKELTVNFIKKNVDSVSGRIKANVPPSAKISGISCCEHLPRKMEKALGVSLEGGHSKGCQFLVLGLRENAVQLHNQ